MNPHLIERLARERLRDRLHRADVDGRLHAAGYPFVRLPFRGLPSIRPLLHRRRHDPCSTPTSSCHA